MVDNMPLQGDIIKLNLDPKQGHEQKGYRPYLCLSHNLVAKNSRVVVLAPISNTTRNYPFYFSLSSIYGIQTTGKVLLDQLVAMDYTARNYNYIENINKEYMGKILNLTKLIFDQDK